MSIEEIAATLYRCRCELPGCPGHGAPWETLKKPPRCKWCKRIGWDGAPDQRCRRETPLRQLTVEERRAYNRAATARSRKRKKEAVLAPAPALIADQIKGFIPLTTLR